MFEFEQPKPIEYPTPLGLHGRYCARCWHYVAATSVICDECHRPVGPVVRIREHAERLAGPAAYCGSTE